MFEPLIKVWSDGNYEVWQWSDDSTPSGENIGTARIVYRIHCRKRPLAWVFTSPNEAIDAIGLVVEITEEIPQSSNAGTTEALAAPQRATRDTAY